ncbi:hypothetical protein [Corynebacterium epidermidicanis]|uniref:Uncharacterized protein n=1 Tax=Corynebacterium epidermidicanis TaxID=1050174 RepID=A0A0G3GRP6_9CORY|nr:hypothetical protein [Corynebacterium epidermidicanis]AKK03866.1 hypothetical protein CEPID_10135 [Corynebacterium epidermidicanis]
MTQPFPSWQTPNSNPFDGRPSVQFVNGMQPQQPAASALPPEAARACGVAWRMLTGNLKVFLLSGLAYVFGVVGVFLVFMASLYFLDEVLALSQSSLNMIAPFAAATLFGGMLFVQAMYVTNLQRAVEQLWRGEKPLRFIDMFGTARCGLVAVCCLLYILLGFVGLAAIFVGLLAAIFFFTYATPIAMHRGPLAAFKESAEVAMRYKMETFLMLLFILAISFLSNIPFLGLFAIPMMFMVPQVMYLAVLDYERANPNLACK